MLAVTAMETLYENPLAAAVDVDDFRLEGRAALSFPGGRLRMEGVLDPEVGQDSNFVFWCPRTFPGDVRISWDFWPIREPGLCMLFFAARGRLTNLRKSHGFERVAQGPDPIPPADRGVPPYRIELTMCDAEIEFAVDGLRCFRWKDHGDIGGPPLSHGKIGFRQMAPLVAEYANLRVERVAKRPGGP